MGNNLSTVAITTAAKHGLHVDVVNEIFSYIEPYTQILRLVCKLWRALEPLDQREVTCKRSRLAETLAREGHLEALKWAHSMRCPFTEWNRHDDEYRDPYFEAVKGNHLPTLEWLSDNGYDSDHASGDIRLYNYIVQNRLASVLQFEVNRKRYMSQYIREGALDDIMHKGYIEMMRILLDAGVNPWSGFCYRAALSGNLDALKLANERGLMLAGVCSGAIRAERDNILLWAIENGCDTRCTTNAYSYLKSKGHTHAVQWGLENKVLDESGCARRSLLEFQTRWNSRRRKRATVDA